MYRADKKKTLEGSCRRLRDVGEVGARSVRRRKARVSALLNDGSKGCTVAPSPCSDAQGAHRAGRRGDQSRSL